MADFWDEWDVSTREYREKAGFDPSQPRDTRGQWTKVGAFIKNIWQEGGGGSFRKVGDSYQFKYPKPFKHKDEAIAWLEKNLCTKAEIDPEVTLEEMNAALSHARMIWDHVTLQKVGTFTMKKLSGALGYYHHFAGPTQIDLDSQSLTEGMKGPLEWKQARLEERLKGVETYQAVVKDLGEKIIKEYERMKLVGPGAQPDPKLETWKSDQASYQRRLESDREAANSLKAEIAELKKGGRLDPARCHTSNMYDNQMAGVLVHELGHHYHHEHSEAVQKDLGLPWQRVDDPEIFELERRGLKITEEDKKTLDPDWKTKFGVGPENDHSRINPREAFATNFELYMLGETKFLNPKMVEFFDGRFPEFNFGGTYKG